MERILLVDHISNITLTDVITEGVDTPKGSIIVRGIVQKADTVNGNGRVYTKHTLEREVQKYISGPIKVGNALGELDHPESTIIELKNTSHRIIKMWWEGNNVMADIEILDTPSGEIAKTLVNTKIPLGISSRGMGSIRQIGETLVVGDDFELLCFDLVSTPSTHGAYLFPVNKSMNESKEIITTGSLNKYSKVNSIISDLFS